MAALKSPRDTFLGDFENRVTCNTFSFEKNFAGRRFNNASDQVKQGRFAGAIRTDDRTKFPGGLDAHIDVVNGDQPAKTAYQSFTFKQRHRNARSFRDC